MRVTFGFFIAALSLSSFANADEEKASCPNGKKQYRTTIRHIESGGIGYNNGYTTFEVFLASDPSRWAVTPFFDARGHVFDNGKWAANVGTGLRTLLGNRAYGINAYYDYRNAGRLNSNQIGIGLETLGKLFDFRINGYLPVGAKISSPYDIFFKNFSGNYMFLSQKYQSAMKGADAEFGFHFGKTKWFDFYAGAGPYYFIGEEDPVTWGGKARISGTFKDILALEISDSYDKTFHNKFQGQISLTFSFGPKSNVKPYGRTCKVANRLNDRMLQPVSRQEIIVINNPTTKKVAIDPATGLPYYFVFVDNTSSSDGTYESPYHSLVQAHNNSSPNDIIYVFPGDGTSTGMDSGIFLKDGQKFWGSGIGHSIQISQGMLSIPAQNSSSPIITNTNVSTDGNAITLATNNAISGFVITSAINDAIYGADSQSLEVSSCTFENTSAYPIEAIFSGDASISLTNNQFLNNINGVALTLNGTSTITCLNNTFEGQTSVSSIPLEITNINNSCIVQIENNLFNGNTTGTIRFNLNDVVNADISLLNNIVTNNTVGSQGVLGSSCVIVSSGTTNQCSITLTDNTFSNNAANAFYMHTSGMIAELEVTASTNTMSDNGTSALIFATPTNALTLVATNNTITGTGDNGIAVISSGTSLTGNITINNNIITDVGGESNGIVVNQDFSSLNLTMLNNIINGCEGTGIISYASDGIDTLILNVSGNTISNCENLSSNAASGLDIEQYTTLVGSIIDNTLSGNAGEAVFVGSALPTPSACLTLTGNDSDADYLLTNPGDGIFNLSPCDVNSANGGTIDTSGTINTVQSCADPTPCPP